MTAATTPTDAKAVATIKAKLAIMGHAVFDLAEGGFIVTRQGHVKFCRDMAELEKFARLVGAVTQEVRQ